MAAVIGAEWLKNQLEDGSHDIVILDVTWYSGKEARSEYLEKHLAGAQWFNIMENVENTEMFPRNLPTAEAFQHQARAVGVNTDSHVILYDNTPHCGFFVGSRAWWMFKLFGHDKVSVLDGGLVSWEAHFPVTADTSQPTEGNFVARKTAAYIKTYEDMVQNLSDGQFQVCDTRPETAYHGDAEDLKTGHYPGAATMTLATVLLDKSNNRLHPVEKLQQILRERGVDVDRPVVTMCRSGMSSSTAALVATLCGATNVAVYLGGFTEWSMKADETDIQQS